MLSFLFDLLSSFVHIAADVLSFLVHTGLNVLSGIASLVAWPIKTALSTLSNWWGVPTQWSPLYLIGGGILILLLLALAFWAAAANRRKGRR